jgi:CRP-like cAMP-binding protein
VIANMATVDSEQRVGKTLSQLTRTLGKKDSHGIRIKTKISHEALSEMVATTRPRISMLMERFRKHGLLETSREHSPVIKEKKRTDYVVKKAARQVCVVRDKSSQNCPLLDRKS